MKGTKMDIMSDKGIFLVPARDLVIKNPLIETGRISITLMEIDELPPLDKGCLKIHCLIIVILLPVVLLTE